MNKGHKEKADKKKKARKGKSKSKHHSTHEPDTVGISPSKRNMAMLRRAKSCAASLGEPQAEMEIEPVENVPKKNRVSRHKSAGSEQKPKPKRRAADRGDKAGEAKAKAKAKAKAASRPAKSTSADGRGKGRGKGKGKGRGKGRGNPGGAATSSKSDAGLLQTFKDFVQLFDPAATPKSTKFKHQVRGQVEELQHFDYNIYWSRASCGLKSKRAEKDIAHFIFSGSSAPDSIKCALAIKCVELYAARP